MTIVCSICPPWPRVIRLTFLGDEEPESEAQAVSSSSVSSSNWLSSGLREPVASMPANCGICQGGEEVYIGVAGMVVLPI